MINTVIHGDALTVLKTFPDELVDCCVTSPPYWGLRDYGVDGQLGLEKTPEEYVAKMVEIFREVKRALKKEGTLWLNLGDSYGGGNGGNVTKSEKQKSNFGTQIEPRRGNMPKQLLGIPWRVAFALQADGWYLRSDIIWHKPNPMPESVTDRPTKSHEYLFLLAKSSKYYFDQEAVKEDGVGTEYDKTKRKQGRMNGSKYLTEGVGQEVIGANFGIGTETRNIRSVWVVPTQSYSGCHFATFPPKLIEPCILAGCPEGGIVLDPFIGSGTTAQVATLHRRNWIGIELNAEYIKLADKRRQVTPRLF